jgi:hypothetical protein
VLAVFFVVVPTAWTALDLVWFNYENPTHKLVYVQTRNSTKEFVEMLAVYKKEHPNLRVLVSNKASPWPLPFYLEGYSVDYYGVESLDESLVAGYDVAILEAKFSRAAGRFLQCKTKRFSRGAGAEFVGIFTRECGGVPQPV